MNNKAAVIISFLLSAALLLGCSVSDPHSNPSNTYPPDDVNNVIGSDGYSVSQDSISIKGKDEIISGIEFSEFKSTDLDDSWRAEGSESINLDASYGVVTVSAGGTYVLSGSLQDGRLLIDSPDDEPVRLVLNGADIFSEDGPAIYVKNAKKLVLILAEGTINSISDGSTYSSVANDENKPNAAVFSMDDLTIIGDGTLSVQANYNNGIYSKDKLKIGGGIITVKAEDDALVGRDCVLISGGKIDLISGDEGIKTTNNDVDKGFIQITGGSVKIVSSGNSVDAESVIKFDGGAVDITSGGGYTEYGKDTDGGMKGLKSDLGIVITGGTISLNSADDAIHSNASVAVDGGDITISTGDDAIHADEHVSITGGNIKINNSHEGIEGAAVHIGGAALSIISDEDGINASGGSDDADDGGRREPDAFKTSNGCIIRVTGGSINIAAGGDGMDSNGGILIVGGTLLINSDINSNNGALDYGSYCVIKGGTVAAAGGTAMAALPTSSSEQPSIALGLSPKRSGAIKIEDGSGSELFEWTPPMEYQSVVLSLPEFSVGSEYTVFIGETEYETVKLAGVLTLSGDSGHTSGGARENRPGSRP